MIILKNTSSMVKHQMMSTFTSMLLAELVIYFIPLPQSFWVPLTTLVVSLTITSSSAAFRRGFQRILGTLCGVALGSIAVLLIDHTYAFLILLAFTGCISYWSKCLSKYYGVFVCLITTLVVMLLAVFFNYQRLLLWELISYRLIDTIIGAVIAYIISILIMPHHQHDKAFSALVHLLIKISSINRVCVLSTCGFIQIKNKVMLRHYQDVDLYMQNTLSIWSYDLLFNRYVYARFQMLIHRINKTMMTLNLFKMIACRQSLNVEDRFYRILKLNSSALIQVVDAISSLQLNLARQRIHRLTIINRILEHEAIKRDDADLMQISALLFSIENDINAILNGVALAFLCDKYREDK